MEGWAYRMNTHKSAKFGLAAGILVSALLAAPAVSNAADVGRGPVPRPVPVPFYNWTGFYVGAHAGAGFSDGDSGFLGGGQIGYNWQIHQWVLGIEGDFAGTTISDSANATVVGPGGIATMHANASLDWVSTLAPRFGYTFDRWLVYGKVGGAWAHASADFNANVVGAGGVSGSVDKTVSGWVLGFGAEYALRDNWTAKFEYNMMDFGSDSLLADDKFHVFKAGINYRFGGPGGF